MARKSAASLTVVSAGSPDSRPKAPKELTKRESALWDDIVATKPADWWSDDNFALLKDYCRHIIRQDNLSRLIEEFSSEKGSMSDLDKLLKMSERESRMIATLATKMRLTQQAKYGPRAAHTAAKKESKGKPWQFGGD